MADALISKKPSANMFSSGLRPTAGMCGKIKIEFCANVVEPKAQNKNLTA